MIKFYVVESECSTPIASFKTFEDAKNELQKYENFDKEDNSYIEDFYMIVEVDN